MNLWEKIVSQYQRYKRNAKKKDTVMVPCDMSEFSMEPGGRYYIDGDGSAEAFREKFLMPKLRSLAEGSVLQIKIDTVEEGYGASFLNDAFAKVVVFGYMDADTLLDRIDLVYSNTTYGFYAKKIKQYIDEAEFNSAEYVPTRK